METIAAAIAPTLAVAPSETRHERLHRVFQRTCDGLYGFILVRAGHDRDSADELLQQTCAVAAGHRRVPDGDQACEAWLRGIARKLLKKHRRLSRRRMFSFEDRGVGHCLARAMEAGPVPDAELTRAEAATQLMLAITGAPADEQRLIFAFYFDARSTADIAAEMGVSEKSIESRLYRIRGRLRARLRGSERNE